MKINLTTNELFTDDGRFLKRLHCPLKKQWHQLQPNHRNSARFCENCSRNVIPSENMSDDALVSLLTKDPETCLKVNLNQRNCSIIR